MGESIPFSELSESEKQNINNNIDEYLPLPDTQLSIERDVLGAMLIFSSISTAKLKHLLPSDFKYPRTRHIYQMIRDISSVKGKFNPEQLLGSNNTINKYILSLMNDSIITNAKVKCDWLVEQKMKFRVARLWYN
jgi:hypothetical protein